MSRTGILLLVAAMGLSSAMHAQHTPLTGQYLFNGLLIDPAYAGSRDVLTATLSYRKQWVGFEGAPTTELLSIHSPLNAKHIALGLIVYNDRIGVSRETGLLTNYAYRMRLGKGKLSLGIGLGFDILQANWSQVQTTASGDPSFASDSRSEMLPNFSTGAYYYTKRYFIGASLPFLFAHQYDATADRWISGGDTRAYQPMLTAGLLVDMTSDLKLKPSMLLRKASGGPIQGDLNLNFIWKDRFWLGASYRQADAVGFSVQVLPTPQFQIGYLYELGISALNCYHQGSHELMIQYEFGYQVKAKDPRYF